MTSSVLMVWQKKHRLFSGNQVCWKNVSPEREGAGPHQPFTRVGGLAKDDPNGRNRWSRTRSCQWFGPITHRLICLNTTPPCPPVANHAASRKTPLPTQRFQRTSAPSHWVDGRGLDHTPVPNPSWAGTVLFGDRAFLVAAGNCTKMPAIFVRKRGLTKKISVFFFL